MEVDVAYEYVAEPDHGLHCVICLDVAEEPWQHGSCGRLLCKECLEKHGRDKLCPSCRMEHPQYFEDNKSRRDIRALIVKCCNTGCAKTMERQLLYEHVHTQCPYTVISCKYEGIGCEAELKRKDMAAHEQDDKLHLHMAIDTVNSQQETIKLLQDKSVVTLNYEESVTLALTGYQKKKEAKECLFFPSFYTSANGYHMSLNVVVNGDGDFKGTHVSAFVSMLEGKYDAGIKWPFIGTVFLTLLNQLEDKNHFTRMMSITAAKKSIMGVPDFIHHFELAHDPVKNTQYLKDDTLYFRMSVAMANHKFWLECTAKMSK